MVSSDKESGIFYYLVGIVCGFIGSFILMVYLVGGSISEIRQEAIDANVGKWVIDEKTGERSFKFSDRFENSEETGR